MAFDGTTLAGIVQELNNKLTGGRVDKISQPEPDEVLINIRSAGVNHKLMLTAHASAPRLGFTTISKISPLKAPMFCMVLRKHLSAGRLIKIIQPDFERIVEFHIDAMDEMGDKSTKILLIEIMGKHSNIMLLDASGKVLDAIKHISPSVSSIRPILPGATYSRPPSKENPLTLSSFEKLMQTITPSNPKIQQALYQKYSGISPVLASEICFRAKVAPDTFVNELTEDEIISIHKTFTSILNQVQEGLFSFNIYYDNTGKAIDLTAINFNTYSHLQAEAYNSPSEMLENFYTKRDTAYRISQKTTDLRKLITTHLERCQKKSHVFDKTLEEIKNRDELKLKGELLTAYLHMLQNLPRDAKIFTAENYYDNNNPLEIPIDPQLTPSENAQKYYKKYNKQKRTHEALKEQIKTNNDDIMYLSSVLVSMETITDEADITEIRAELSEQGFAKRKSNTAKKANAKAKPLKFTSSDGFDIYVGKNNTQNDYLTLRQANSSDIWLHTKDIAGSHVIISANGKDVPETTILEAANLAAFHSRAKNSSQVPVDYVAKKHVRKPTGAKPGFVIYDYHKTVYVTPSEKLEEVK